MVLHHFLYDLCEFLGAPWWLFTNPVFDVLHYFFAGLFIFLSGISSDFSRSNLKRGAKAMALALGITLVTYFMDMTIVFGVLHLLASCMLLFGLTRVDSGRRCPPGCCRSLCLALIFLTAPCADSVTTRRHRTCGSSASPRPTSPRRTISRCCRGSSCSCSAPGQGAMSKAGRLPQWFYTAKAPRLALVGRHALVLYVLHQPLLYALTMLLRLIFIR